MSRGSRSIVVHFACNDGRNGLFAGEAEAITIDLAGGQLELYGWARRFAVDDKGLKLRIHGAWFPFMSSREWVGNWCWNAYRLKRPQALRLLAHLRWHGWKCEAGRVHACRWFDRLTVKPAPLAAAGVALPDGSQQPGGPNA